MNHRSGSRVCMRLSSFNTSTFNFQSFLGSFSELTDFQGLRTTETKSTALSAALMAWWTSRSRAYEPCMSHADPWHTLYTLVMFLWCFQHFALHVTFANIDENDHQWCIIALSLGCLEVVSIVSAIHAFNQLFTKVLLSHTCTVVQSCSIGWSNLFSLLRLTFEHLWRLSNSLQSFATLSAAQASSCKKTRNLMYQKIEEAPECTCNMIAAQWSSHMKSVGAKMRRQTRPMNTNDESLRCAFNGPISSTCLVT